MRFVTIIFLLASITHVGLSQNSQESKIQAVHALARQCAVKRSKARVLFRSLIGSEGKLVKFDADSFYLKNGRRYYRSFYRDVLEMRCGGGFVTNVPEGSARQYGSWNDVGHVYPGTKILVVLTDGKIVKGFSNSATATGLIFIERERHERMDIRRDQVSAVYGLVGGYGGVKKGASKGAEGIAVGRDQLLTGVFAGMGALVGLVKSDGRPILIYSR